MRKELIFLDDWKRILFGEAPAIFLLEVLGRTIFMYLMLQIVARLMGKRMSGQLTIMEMAVMITLGAIVSAPMEVPDRGLLQGLFILILALLFHRGVNFWGVKNRNFELLIQGRATTLVKDGIIQVDTLESERVSRQQLYAALRNENIYNLGKVERVYLEACGVFSIYTFSEAAPGLTIFPATDEHIQKFSEKHVAEGKACTNCGNVEKIQDTKAACSNCGEKEWIQASTEY
jgi:uncharacterized membrane protein YcaP (DUF421 family)